MKGQNMAIKKLARHEFDAHGIIRAPATEIIGEEKEWYSDEGGNVLGIVIRDRTDNDWGYVVLGRDKAGKFRWIDGRHSMATEKKARAELKQKLADLSASGKTVFPQGDEDE